MPQTRRQARVERLEAFSPELQEALAWHMLPRLTIHQLAAFACACTAFRDAAYLREDLWRSLAAEQLPPQHPSLSGCDRAAVQKVLQRRHDARTNLLNGQTGPVLRTTCPGAVFKLQYSLDGQYVAVAVMNHGWSHIAAFSANTGEQLWQTEFSAILEACSMEKEALWFDMQWHCVAESMTVCVMSVAGERHPARDLQQHLFQLDSHTGVISPLASCLVSENAALTAQSRVFRHRLAFSHGGSFIAALHMTVDLDVNDSFRTVILVMKNSRVHLLGGPDDMEMKERFFDRTGSYYGHTLALSDIRHNLAQVFDTASGAELFRVENHSFRAVFMSRQWALLTSWIGPTFSNFTGEIWDLEKRVCLQAKTFFHARVIGHFKLALDSWLLGSNDTANSLTLWNVMTGSSAAAVPLSYSQMFCIGPDECSLATVTAYEEPGLDENFTLSLVRLC